MITQLIPKNIDIVEKEIKEFIENKKFKIFNIIDQAAEAKEVGLTIKPTKLIIFGNPKVGTLLMQENDEITFELPIKILLIGDDNTTKVIYRDPFDFSGSDIVAAGGHTILQNMHNMYQEMIRNLLN